MPVWFAYRNFDLGPTGKYLRRFDEDDTVLRWFRRHWDRLAVGGEDDREEAGERLAELVGCNGWCRMNPFHRAAVRGTPPPSNDASLMAVLRADAAETLHVAGTAHSVQVFTEDDGEGGAIFYFDGHFLREHSGHAAYLLHEDWRLPSGAGDGEFRPSVPTVPLTPGGDGPGTTWFVPLEQESKYPLDDLTGFGGYQIEGVRLPGLARHLCGLSLAVDDHGECPRRLRQLPALMLAGVEPADRTEAGFVRAVRSAPAEAANWAAWADWRQERGEVPPGVSLLRDAFARSARFPGNLKGYATRNATLATASRKLLELEEEQRVQGNLRTSPHSLIHVEDHLAQVCLDVSWTDRPYFNQLIFFDDLWASAHPDLANALLRFAARWDVLTVE